MKDIDNRIEWIDIAKGIGIIIVIIGHTISLRYSMVLYTFHMPLFFLISGLLVKPKDNFGKTLMWGVKKLLRPWTIMAVISFLVVVLIPEWRELLTMKGLFLDFYSANTNLIQNSPLWYLICFFVVFLLFYPLAKYVKKPLTHRSLIVICLASIVVLYTKPLLSTLPLPSGRLPFKIDTAIVALAFFAAGYYYRDKVFAFVGKAKWQSVAVLFVVWVALASFNGWTNLNSFDFGRIRYLFYPIAFAGITIVLMTAHKISETPINWLKRTLAFYGKNSLLIFGFQSLFIRLYLLAFNHLSSLQMELYADNPSVHQIGSFLIVTSIVSPLVVLLFNKLNKIGLKII